jgi:hypothetical protein
VLLPFIYFLTSFPSLLFTFSVYIHPTYGQRWVTHPFFWTNQEERSIYLGGQNSEQTKRPKTGRLDLWMDGGEGILLETILRLGQALSFSLSFLPLDRFLCLFGNISPLHLLFFSSFLSLTSKIPYLLCSCSMSDYTWKIYV